MLVFRVLTFLWPFLKEMILGDKTVVQATKKHKGRLFVIAVIFLSIILNFFTIPRLLEISAQHVALKKKHEEVLRELAVLQRHPPPARAEGPKVETKPVNIPKPTPPPVQDTSENLARYRKIKEAFAKIKEKEEREMASYTK